MWTKVKAGFLFTDEFFQCLRKLSISEKTDQLTRPTVWTNFVCVAALIWDTITSIINKHNEKKFSVYNFGNECSKL